MNKHQEEELLEITQAMMEELNKPTLTLSQEEKDEVTLITESMFFFMDSGEGDRAISEGRKILNILSPF